MNSINTKTDQAFIKEKALKMILKQLGHVAVCFSGGLDSMLLLIEACKILGSDNVVAITGVSPIVIERDITNAEKITSKYGIKHIIIARDEMENVNFIKNDEKRCYYCKKAFFEKIKKVASENGFNKIIDGTNFDDLSDYRPGHKALKEFSIISPLKDAKMGKSDIHAVLEKMGISSSNMISGSCLATRIPYFEPITYHRIELIGKAEDFLHKKGFKNARARFHDSLVKIEVDEKDILSIMDKSMRLEINAYMKSIGFTWTSIDVLGYRIGSMNEDL